MKIENPEGFDLKLLMETVTRNYSLCLQNAEQLKGLQEWISRQEKVRNQ